MASPDLKKQKIDSISQFLHLPASTLGHIGTMKTIDTRKSISEALKSISDSKVYSLPVLDGSQLVGLITVKQIVKLLLEEFYKIAGIQSKSASEKEKIMGSHGFTDNDVRHVLENLSKKSVADHVDIVSSPLKDSSSVLDVITELQVHDRVVAVDSNGMLHNLFSQSRITKYLAHHLEALGSLADQEIGKIPNFVTKPVKIVHGETKVLAALCVMVEERFSSIGFTNEDGDVEGVMSFKDVRFAVNNFSLLFRPIAEFVNEIRRTDTENLLRDVVPTVNCSTSDSLKKVIGKLTAVGIHRLFVREKEEKGYHFSGIITLSDVLKLIVRSK